MKRIIASVALLVLAGCFNSIPTAANDLTQRMTVTGQSGFDMADELALSVSDPAKRAEVRAKIAEARVAFLLASSQLSQAITSGLTPEQVQKWLAAAQAVRMEIEAVRAAVTSKPSK